MGIIHLAGGQRRPGVLGRSIAPGQKEFTRVTKPLEPPETIETESQTVDCDGGGGALGHPRVWLNMEGKGEIDCPYCDRRFVLKQGATSAGH